MILGKKKDKIKVKNDNKKKYVLEEHVRGLHRYAIYIYLYNNSSIS